MMALPPIICSTHLLKANHILTASRGICGSPAALRFFLAALWCALHICLVPTHLQFFVQEGFKDSVKDLKSREVNADRVRMHFQKRATLVVYSACQYCCFPVFVLVLLLFTAHKSGMGALGHSQALNFGSFASGPSAPPPISRSPIYDSFQSALYRSHLTHCDILPIGAYANEEATTVGSGRQGPPPGNAGGRVTGAPGHEDVWKSNAELIDYSLKDALEDEDLRSAIQGPAGYAKVILLRMDEPLNDIQDKKKAKSVKAAAEKVRRLLFAVVSHTLVSPPNYVLCADMLGIILCILWVTVYVFGVLKTGYLRDKSDRAIDFEFVAEVKEVPRDPRIRSKKEP